MSAPRGGAPFRSRGGPRTAGHATTAQRGQKQQQQQEEETEEVAALRQKYGEELSLVSPLFPEWSSEDILIALGEANGSAELAIARIAEGESTQLVYRASNAV